MVNRDQIDTQFDVFEPPNRDGRRLIAETDGTSEPRPVEGEARPWEKTGSMTLIEVLHVLTPDAKLDS